MKSDWRDACSVVNRTRRKLGAGLELLLPPHPIVRKCGELTATEHTMMQREMAFINTGVRASLANNRGNDDGRQWAWGGAGREGCDDSISDNN